MAIGSVDAAAIRSQECVIIIVASRLCVPSFAYPSCLATSPRKWTDELDKPELLEVKQKWDRQGLDVTYLLTQTARDPTLSLAFNYASLLLNNSYFLEGLVCLRSRSPYRT